MKKEEIMKVLRTQKSKLTKHAPVVASTVAVAGVIFTVALTARATMKATRIIDKMSEEEKTPKEIVKKTWKLYIPPVAAGVMTISCIVAATTMNQRRYLTMAGLYTATNEAFQEYKETAKEVVGESKEKKIQEKVSEKRVENSDFPPSMMGVYSDDTLCYDSWSDRYFSGTRDSIEKKVNEFNQRLIWEHWLCANELYYELGLDWCESGDMVGWRADNLCQVSFDAKVAPNGKPCLVMNFHTTPVIDF